MDKYNSVKDFALPLFFPIKSGDEIDLRIYLLATVRLEDAKLFRQKLSLDPSRFEPSQLGEYLSNLDELRNIVNLECTAYSADFLCDDPMVAEQIVGKVEEPLAQAFRERGLHLVKVERFGARRIELEEQVKEELRLEDSIDRLLLDAEKKGLLKHSELERFKKSLAWEEEDEERDRRLDQLSKDYEEKRLKLSLQSELTREEFTKENRLLRGWLIDRLEIEGRLGSYRRQEQIKEAHKEREVTSIKEGRRFPRWGIALIILGTALGVWTSIAGCFPPWACGGPIADFAVDHTSGNAPLTVEFTDQSTGSVTSWSWEFGDGHISDTQNPSHTYTSEGKYTVKLTVSGPGGSDTETKSDYIMVGTSLTVTPLTSDEEPGHIGQSVTINGVAFEPNAEVTITYTSEPVVVGTTQTDASGDFSFSFRVPESSAGTHTIAASDGTNSLTVPFYMGQWSLETSVSPAGSGTVYPSGGSYASGSQVTLMATPASGYKFDHWSGNTSGASTTTTITMNRSYRVTANFVPVDGNSPPNTPSIASGPSSGYTDTSYTYSTSATDPDGDQVKYVFDWDDGSTSETGFVSSGTTASKSHSWSSSGTYYVKTKAVDSNGASSAWSSSKTVTITQEKSPPNTPSIASGPSSGYTDTFYTYSTSATDPDGDQVKYVFDWDDGSTSETGFVSSGTTASKSHSWSSPGTYEICVQAIDSNGASSAWLNCTRSVDIEEDSDPIIFHIDGCGVWGYSSWIQYSKWLGAAEEVTGSVQLEGLHSIYYDSTWWVEVYDPLDNVIRSYSAELDDSPPVIVFNFTPSYEGEYKIRVTHKDWYSKDGTMTISPPGWG